MICLYQYYKRKFLSTKLSNIVVSIKEKASNYQKLKKIVFTRVPMPRMKMCHFSWKMSDVILWSYFYERFVCTQAHCK